MTYEIGQKVETPLGVGEVKGARQYHKPIYQIKFMDSNFKVLDFEEDELKPYKTPHEKLLDMGFEFEEVLDWGGNPFSHNWRKDDQRITIYLSENTITTYEVCKEAIAVLTQYLEWLEEEK